MLLTANISFFKKIATMKVDVFSQRRAYVWCLNYLAVSGLFIARDWLSKRYYFIMTIFSGSGMCIMFYSVYVFINDIDSTAVLMHHNMLLVSTAIGIQISFHLRTSFKALVKGAAMSYDYQSQLVSQFLDVLQEEREKTMKRVLNYIVFTAFFMQINIMIFAILEMKLRNLEYMLLYPCWFPFDVSYLPSNIIAYIWQHFLIELMSHTICGVMALIYLINSHLSSQIVLLKYAISNLKKRAFELVNSTSQVNAEEKFEDRLRKSYLTVTNQCVEHHFMIIDYYNIANKLCKIIFQAIFLTGLIILIATGFALVSENTALKIKFIGVNLIQMIYLYLLCLMTEKLSELGESIRLSIYETEWYDMPKECQSSLKLMVERTLRPLDFYTLTGQKVNLENYMGIVNAAYSYFNMMLATNQK